MALVNGTEYYFIDMQQASGGNTTRHLLKDTNGRSMIAPTEASSTASAAHAKGSYFIYGTTLYQATADIASGGTITPNTNCKAVALSAEVSDLKSNLQALYANATNFPDTANVRIGYTINNSGEKTGNAKRALIERWKYSGTAIKAIGIDSSTYDFLVGVYTTTEDLSFVRKLTDSFTHDIQLLPDDANYFTVVVTRKDNANIASSEADAIRSSILRYGYIDNTLTKSGFAADAKTTGEAYHSLIHKVGFSDSLILEIGKTWNSGNFTNNSARATTAQIYPRMVRTVAIEGDTYLYHIPVWDTESHYDKLITSDWTNKETFIPRDIYAFAVIIKRVDGGNIADSEESAIRSAIKFYYMTDDTLSIRGVPADAKTTGDVLYKPMHVKMAMEHGSLRDVGEYSGFLQDRENIYSSFYTSMRTPHMLDVSMAKTLAFSTDYDTIDVFAYDDQYAFISITSIASDSTFSVPSGVHYVRFVAKKTNNATINEIESSITVISTGSVRVIYSPDHRATNTTGMCFVVKGKSATGSMKDSTALLRLPPNYSVDGEPVPLLVHMHGTTGYKSKWQTSLVIWNDEENTNPLRTDIVSYIVNEGFAVLDVFGHIENYVDGYAYPYGSPDQMLCIASAIERVMNVYNVRKDGIYISGISAGGVPSITQVFHNNVPVKCCALLAPTVSLFRNCFGANASGRKEWAAAAGFIGDDSVLNGYMGQDKYMYHPTINNALKEYFAANIDKVISYNPIWSGLIGVPQSTLTQWALSDSTEAPGSKLGGGDDVAENWADKYRVCHKPIKLWVADDDTNISPPICHNFMTTLRNANCPAVERIMPDGEGGHYAFTTSETVETLSGKTALGIDYTGIPYPWIEMIQFFRMY